MLSLSDHLFKGKIKGAADCWRPSFLCYIIFIKDTFGPQEHDLSAACPNLSAHAQYFPFGACCHFAGLNVSFPPATNIELFSRHNMIVIYQQWVRGQPVSHCTKRNEKECVCVCDCRGVALVLSRHPTELGRVKISLITVLRQALHLHWKRVRGFIGQFPKRKRRKKINMLLLRK